MNNASLKDDWTCDPEYRRHFQSDEDIETIVQMLALEEASMLVDIGCGNGAFAIAAARRYPACRVLAFDALDSAVAHCGAAAQGLTNFQVEVALAHSIPLPDCCADRVLFRCVLHHLAEPQPAYAELSRVLRPGGLLVLQAPCNYWEASFGQVLSDMMMLDDDSHRRFYHRPAEIVAGLQAAGLTPAQPECWPYVTPTFDDRAAQFIKQRHAEERLHLRQVENGKWSIERYWFRVVAEKAR